mgnify:CR=1 FL=1
MIDNAYALVLEFSSTLDEAKWNEFQPKIQSFFGPGIVATVTKTGAGVDVALICDGSGAGRSGKDKKVRWAPGSPSTKPIPDKTRGEKFNATVLTWFCVVHVCRTCCPRFCRA